MPKKTAPKKAAAKPVAKTKTTTTKAAPEMNVTMAVLAYIIFLIPLLTDAKEDPFVKFHIKQGIILMLFFIITYVISAVIPVLGWFVFGPITTIMTIVFGVIGILNAVNKQQKELPLIGKYAEKYLKF